MMGTYATALMTTTTTTTDVAPVVAPVVASESLTIPAPATTPPRPICPVPDRGPDYVYDTEDDDDEGQAPVPSPVPLQRQEGGLPVPQPAPPQLIPTLPSIQVPLPGPTPLPASQPLLRFPFTLRPADPVLAGPASVTSTLAGPALTSPALTTPTSSTKLTRTQHRDLVLLAERQRMELEHERNLILLRRQENLHLNDILVVQSHWMEKCIALSEKLNEVSKDTPAVTAHLKERVQWTQLALEVTEALNALSPLVAPTVNALRAENVGGGAGSTGSTGNTGSAAGGPVPSTTTPRRQKRKATYVPSDSEPSSTSSESKVDLTRSPPVRKAAKKAAKTCKKMLGRGKK